MDDKKSIRDMFVFSLFRYFKVEGLGDTSNWEKAIKNYMTNSGCKNLDLIYTISSIVQLKAAIISSYNNSFQYCQAYKTFIDGRQEKVVV